MFCKRCGYDRPQWEFSLTLAQLRNGLGPVNPEVIWRKSHCIHCAKIMAASWRKRHPDRQAKARKSWNQRNPEKCRAARKRNKINQPESLRLRRKRYRKRHRAKENARTRAYWKRHPEVRRRHKRTWKRNQVIELRPWYLKELLRHHHGRRIKPTAEELAAQKLKTQIWRTKKTLEAMAASSMLGR